MNQIIGLRLITPASYVFLLAIALWMFLHPGETFPYGYFGGELPFFIATLGAATEALFFPYYYYLFTRCALCAGLPCSEWSVANFVVSLVLERHQGQQPEAQSRGTWSLASPSSFDNIWSSFLPSSLTTCSILRRARKAVCGSCATVSTP